MEHTGIMKEPGDNTSRNRQEFKVVAGNLPYSQTVVAHVSRDGHYYIHPDVNQNRSLTPREVARLQTFPDSYYFESVKETPGRTAAFRQIGNAVPVRLAYSVAVAVKNLLDDNSNSEARKKAIRSYNMAQIKSKDTKPEIWFRKQLFAKGIRYHKNVNTVPGHPDIWLKKYNCAGFVHGCFWHRHEGCKYAPSPHSHTDFWEDKFRKNVIRDNEVRNELKTQGIRMLIIWECAVKRMIQSEEFNHEVMNKVLDFLNSDQEDLEIG